MNHPNGSIGNYTYEKIDDKNVRIVCTNPYPDEFDKGIIISMSRKFKPAGIISVKVNIDESKPTRSKAGDSTTFLVSW